MKMFIKIYILLFIFIGNILYSQNIKIQYDIKYITDTIENNPETKTMVLYVTPQKKYLLIPQISMEVKTMKSFSIMILQQCAKEARSLNIFQLKLNCFQLLKLCQNLNGLFQIN